MALKITVDISDYEQKALEHFLLDIDKWVQDAVKHKILQCTKRAIELHSNLNVHKLTPLEVKQEIERLALAKRTSDEVK